jgi:guanylate kinase
MAERKSYIRGPMLVVLSAPSGAGKTTICRELLKRHSNIQMSISATTRPRAQGERQGRDYFFLSKKEFETKIKEGWFVEWARVYDHYYGTPVEQVEKKLAQKKVVLFDIDIQGGQSIKKSYPDAVTIFILPPSVSALKQRLRSRSRDSTVEIDKRLSHALKEIEMRTKYDYTVVNKDIDRAVSQVETILEAESLKTSRNIATRSVE